MIGINKKMRLFLLIGLITLSSCEKDEFGEIDIPPPISQTIYKESYLNQRSGTYFIWGNGSESYSLNIGTNQTGGTLEFSQGASYYDVNNDGFQDILACPYYDDGTIRRASAHWFINEGDDKTYIKDSSFINDNTDGFTGHKILKTDVNNDNLADFILLGVDESQPGNYGGNFTVLIQQTDSTFNVNEVDNGFGLWYHNGATGDINGDGNVDVITAQDIWYGDGTGNFTNSNFDLHQYTNPILTYEIIDINKDGFNDMVLGTHEIYGYTTSIVLGKSNGFDTSNTVIPLPNTNTEYTMDIEFMDIDNDGDLDIIEGRYDGNRSELVLYINHNLNFTLDTTILSESLDGGGINGSSDNYGWTQFKIDDIDKDGVDDIICENYHDGIYNGLKLINGVWVKYIFN
jgi:hypothetical protein